MSTQLLFGDLVEVLESSLTWIKIRNQYDGYEGWVDFKQITALDQDEFEKLKEAPFVVNARHMQDYAGYGQEQIMLPAGCSIPLLNEAEQGVGGKAFRFYGETVPFEFRGANAILETAMGFRSFPYLWGGKTCLGLDCSGFTQVVYKLNGIRLLRDAIQQASQGGLINLLSESVPADLAFFDHDDGRIGHVGILIDQSHVIHCSGKVRVDLIDHQGIYNSDLKRYTHSLRVIRRMPALTRAAGGS
jgi:hypothetical protein